MDSDTEFNCDSESTLSLGRNSKEKTTAIGSYPNPWPGDGARVFGERIPITLYN